MHEHTAGITKAPAKGRRTGHTNGGVAIIVHGAAGYKFAYRYRTRKIQAVGIRIKAYI